MKKQDKIKKKIKVKMIKRKFKMGKSTMMKKESLSGKLRVGMKVKVVVKMMKVKIQINK